MRKCRIAVSVLLTILLCSQFSLSKTNKSDWNNVRILQSGSTIVVKTKLGEKFEGTLDQATVNSLSIVVTVPRVMRRLIDLRKDEIKEVRTKLSRLASSAAGMGIGIGVGVGLGAIADSTSRSGEDPGLAKVALGFTGALLGSALGGAFGFPSRKIYEAP